jgi:hypothetical protein
MVNVLLVVCTIIMVMHYWKTCSHITQHTTHFSMVSSKTTIVILWFPWWFNLVDGPTWQRTPLKVHSNHFWWSPCGIASGIFYQINIYKKIFRAAGGGRG